MDEQTAKDLDETRRLLYGAMAVRRTKHWELAGSLVNALLHHSGLFTNADLAMDEVIRIIEGEDRIGLANMMIGKINSMLSENSEQ